MKASKKSTLSKKPMSMLLVFVGMHSFILAQTKEFPHQEIIKKEIKFDASQADNSLFIGNVNGSILVEGYDGNKIVIELKKNINSNSKKETLRGVEEIQFKIHKEGNKVFGYMDSPHTKLNTKEESYVFNNDCNGKPCYKYTFTLNYKIKVPRKIDLMLQMVDKGPIQVKDIHGNKITTWNANGSINLDGITASVDAKTVEGDIDVSFANNPRSRCDFTTVNGNILAKFKKGMNAEISYQIRTGRFHNDFMKSKNKTKITDFVKGKIDVGNGKTPLNFNLVSGDIEIKSL